MEETIKEFAKKIVESIKKVFTPSQEETSDKKDNKEEQDSTATDNPGQPGPLIGPSGF